jgi:aminoglycoside phosphotransferase (APT) family kinase protein
MPKLKKLPQDDKFPHLAVVFDADRLAATLQALPEFAARGIGVQSIKVKRVYYKPGQSCRITWNAKLRDRDGRKVEQFYFARMLPEDKLHAAWARAGRAAMTAPALGPALALLPQAQMILWAYPNDPNLPGLATLASPDAVAQAVEADPAAFGFAAPGCVTDVRSGVGKYVPGQRCGYRYRVRWEGVEGATEREFYGKAYRDGAGRAAFSILQALAASDAVRNGRLRIPLPYGYDATHAIVWQEMVPGRSFSKNARALDLAAVASPVARALGAFHASHLALGPGLGLETELAELAGSCRKIERAYPQLAGRVQALHDRLVAQAPGLTAVPPGPVHGSFKSSHIFAADGQVAFIDFDGAGIGDPTYDVGRFLAHLAVAGLNSKADAGAIETAIEAFARAYGATVPWGWAEDRVRWYTAALLVSSQAYKCVKRMVPDRVEAILAAAELWAPAP